MPKERVNWRPISALPLIGDMVDSLLDEAEEQYAILHECRRKPQRLDNATIGRYIDVYSAQADDLRLYEEQLSRWKNLDLTPSQRQQVNRLSEQIQTIKDRVTAILALAEKLKGGTIEAVLAKSDLELGLEVVFGNRQRDK